MSQHFHTERCYAMGPGDTEVLICDSDEPSPTRPDPRIYVLWLDSQRDADGTLVTWVLLLAMLAVVVGIVWL